MKDLMARNLGVSKYKNQPTYPMFRRTDRKNKTIITKEHTADIVGRDAPGVGVYDASAEKLFKATRK